MQTQRRFDLKLSVPDYYKIIEMKTGALFAAAIALIGDLRAVVRHRAVNLRNRRRADRGFVDRGEQLADGPAEPRLDRAADRVEGEGRQRVLQPHQIVRSILADQIRPCREGLAKLDRGGADRLERVGVARCLRHARAEPRQPDKAAQARRRVGIALDALQRPVAREDAAPLQQAPRMDDWGGHLFSPSPSGEGLGVGECHG